MFSNAGFALLFGFLIALSHAANSRSSCTQDSLPRVPKGYLPHDLPEGGFQGWYTRVTTPDNGLSLAMIIGEHIEEEVEDEEGGSPHSSGNPPVLCMVLMQPGLTPGGRKSLPPPLASFTRYFDQLDVLPFTDARHDDHAQSHWHLPSLRPKNSSQQHSSSGDEVIGFVARTKGHSTKGWDRFGQDETGPLPRSNPSLEEAHCSFEVRPGMVEMRATLPGAVDLLVRSTPGSPAASLPWTPTRDEAEGWVSGLGPLLGLHYSALSLRTPVTYELTLGPHADDPHHVTAQPRLQQPQHRQPQRQARHLQQQNQSRGVYQEPEMRGQGTAHLEAQYGHGFPQRWIWAEGMSYGSAAAAGVPVNASTPGVSWVMAGGDLPLVYPWLPSPHQFLFSYRDTSTGFSMSVDPWDPALPLFGIKEVMDACEGTASITLGSLTHVVQIDLEADPKTFTPVACPSEKGFVELSVETYAATARIQIFQRDVSLPSLLHLLGGVGRVRQGATRGLKLLAETSMTAAALEFGGDYRCRSRSGKA